MICVRCKNNFDNSIPERNTENYEGLSYYACPHCGKLYRFKRIIVSQPVDDVNIYNKEDDWGNKIVKDKDYVDNA